METNPRHVLVGAFVLALLAGIVGFLVWLSDPRTSTSTRAYIIYIDGKVTGLAAGTAVRYQGVPVGRVRSVRIMPDQAKFIEAVIEVDNALVLREGATATLERPGLTGQVFVQLSGGAPDSPILLARGDEQMPVIKYKAPPIDQIADDVPQLLNRTNALLADVASLVSADNRAQVTQTLANVAALTRALSDQADQIGQLVQTGARAMAAVELTVERYGAVGTALEGTAAATTDLARKVGSASDEATRTLQDLRATAASIAQLARQVDGLVAENRQPVRDFTQHGLYEVAQLATETRALMVALTRVAEKLERDPARFLFGDQQKGREAK
ncbi:MAG: MCE family protein [Alphaproteobacteria bacterium]|nr:MCE family protein [Alphaproteobacteria bacterium]